MYCDIPEFGRCCFCLPLRRGILLFGYIHVFFSAFMVGVYSYYSKYETVRLIYRGVTSNNPSVGISIAIYCIETIVNCLLVYGAHAKNVILLKVFYYFTMTSMVAALVFQIDEEVNRSYLREPELLILTFTVFCIQLYLVLLVRSLLKKLTPGTEHSIENQLHTIVLGEPRIENRVYNNTTVTPLKDGAN